MIHKNNEGTIDLNSTNFGKLKFVDSAGWRMKCECGNEIIVLPKQVLKEGVRSCGQCSN